VKRKEVRVRVTFDPIDFAVDLFIALILLWALKPVWLPFWQDLFGGK